MARPKSQLEQIAYRLILTREALGYTPTELCKLVGVSTSMYSNWESGVRLPDVNKLFKFHLALGYTTDWIYFGNRNSLPTDLRAKIALREQERRSDLRA